MPTRNKTGPYGKGPATGKDLGNCIKTQEPQPRLCQRNRHRRKPRINQGPINNHQNTRRINRQPENNQNIKKRIKWLENQKTKLQNEINRLKQKLKQE
ncbi:hypothetical protein AMET1_1430 [Methanonatronarchaeum thermophilum]|uniref:Uncharacterized protein n=1 Tax=Methanonatronarchaeum thermophilum TaxID=1927129 RepID=A0A1Y3GAM6_9EURY|nr:DUF5320 domain-containing protein [Methanonatronarchaeum thermophilum]OUJ18511.1 hypothetical protein AMET1_1430 [Methanonatronarchaeum thermophilum]